MATIREVEGAILRMTEDEFKAFEPKMGPAGFGREYYITQFAAEAMPERRFCRALGLKTEDEKRTEAVLDTAKATVDVAHAAKASSEAANQSVEIARESMALAEKTLKEVKKYTAAAWIAALVALASLIVSISR